MSVWEILVWKTAAELFFYHPLNNNLTLLLFTHSNIKQNKLY